MEGDVLKTSVLAKKEMPQRLLQVLHLQNLSLASLCYHTKVVNIGWWCMGVIEDSIDGEFLLQSLCELPLREQSLFAGGGGGGGGVLVNGW